MPACAIRYRLDGPGPAAFLVDCDGQYHVYARGTLGGALPANRLLALLADRGCRWVPASGEIALDLPVGVPTPRPGAPPEVAVPSILADPGALGELPSANA